MRDPYSVLGVKPTASLDEIKAAWRALAKSLHPDRNQSDPNAHLRFAEVGQAYQLLKDPEKRQRFDQERRMAEEARKREQAAGGPRSADPPPKTDTSDGDILSSLWRKMAGQPNTPDKAPDLAVEVQVSIEAIFQKIRPLVQLPDGRTLRVALPEGVTDGRQARIAAQGHRLPGLKRGDVVVTFASLRIRSSAPTVLTFTRTCRWTSKMRFSVAKPSLTRPMAPSASPCRTGPAPTVPCG